MVYRPTARVLSVLELLQSHGQMTGPELAARLEVDVRTVRRYVTTLQDMGVPVEAELGRAGGYALRPGYKLPPLMFNDDEVLVLTLGLMAARRSGMAGAGAAAESALAKIERVLPHALRERLHALQEGMRVDDEPPDVPVAGEVIAALSLASQQGRQARLNYEGSAGSSERVIDPYTVVRHQGRWYVIGWCHLRQGRRVFRLDRVTAAVMLESRFTPPPPFDALDDLLSSFEAIPDRWQVEVLLHLPLHEARQRIPRALATLVASGAATRLRASIADLDAMARTLLSLGCRLEVIRPSELRAAFARLADEARRVSVSE